MEPRSAPPFDPVAWPLWQGVVDTLLGGSGPRFDERTLPRARAEGAKGPEMALEGRASTHRDVAVDGPAGPITLAVFTPENHAAPSCGMVWLHGGGMVSGNRFDAPDAVAMMEPFGGVVVSVEYRLAPEHPAPAPVDDCAAAFAWVAAHAEGFGIDPAHLVLGGASAGGGLAAATALRCRDAGGPRAAALLCLCPMLDDRAETVSANQFGDELLWTAASNAFGWRCLLGDRVGTDAVTIYDAPGRAEDLSGLPPTFIDVGSADLFRDEDVAFASRIWASGGDAELHVWPGGFHAFEFIAPHAPLTVDAHTARHRWLARILGTDAAESTNRA